MAVTTGIARLLTRDELSHIKQRDTLISSVAASIAAERIARLRAMAGRGLVAA